MICDFYATYVNANIASCISVSPFICDDIPRHNLLVFGIGELCPMNAVSSSLARHQLLTDKTLYLLCRPYNLYKESLCDIFLGGDVNFIYVFIYFSNIPLLSAFFLLYSYDCLVVLNGPCFEVSFELHFHNQPSKKVNLLQI